MSENNRNTTANSEDVDLHKNIEISALLWNKDDLVKRIQLFLETRMLQALCKQHPSPEIVSADQFHRFEQFVFQFQKAIEDFSSKIEAVFRRNDLQIETIAITIQDGVVAVRNHMQRVVSTAELNVANAMQAAVASIETPMAIGDLEDESILTLLDTLPEGKSFSADQFFSEEKELEPIIDVEFNDSDTPNLWNLAQEQQTREAAENGDGNVPPFRWSWTDEELFAEHKIKEIVYLSHTTDEIVKLWYKMEDELVTKLDEWCKECSGGVATSDDNPSPKANQPKPIDAKTREEMANILKTILLDLREQAFELIEVPFGNVTPDTIRKSLAMCAQRSFDYVGTKAPEEKYLPTISAFINACEESNLRLSAMPTVDSRHVSNADITYMPKRQSDQVYFLCKRSQLQKIIADSRDPGAPNLEKKVIEHCRTKYGNCDDADKKLHSALEVTRQIVTQIKIVVSDFPEEQSFDDLPACHRAFKGVLGKMLETISSYHTDTLSAVEIMEIRNIASFHIVWNLRMRAIRLTVDAAGQSTDAYRELENFYPTPLSQASFEPEPELTAEADMQESVGSEPLTKDKLLELWQTAIGEFQLYVCVQPFMCIMNEDENRLEVFGVDTKQFEEDGICVIEEFCSSGPVGKRRQATLKRKLIDIGRKWDVNNANNANDVIMRNCFRSLCTGINRIFDLSASTAVNEKLSECMPKTKLKARLADLMSAGDSKRVTWACTTIDTTSYDETHKYCKIQIDKLYDELPSSLTQREFCSFMDAVKQLINVLKESFKSSLHLKFVRGEYEKSMDTTISLMERGVNAYFDLPISTEESQPVPTEQKRAVQKDKPDNKILRQTLVDWWDSVGLHATNCLQVDIQQGDYSTTCVTDSIIGCIPNLARADINSQAEATQFVNTMRQRVQNIPPTVAINGITVSFPKTLQVFLSKQVEMLAAGCISFGWHIKQQAQMQPSQDPPNSDADANSDSERGTPPNNQKPEQPEGVSELLGAYDVTPEKAVNSLAEAIGAHVANAATESVANETGAGIEETVRNLRECIKRATAKAQTQLGTVEPTSFTPDQLAEITKQAFNSALENASLPAQVEEHMRTSLSEQAELLSGAPEDADSILEFVMEGGGTGTSGFENRVRLLEEAESQRIDTTHMQQVQHLEGQCSAEQGQIDIVLVALTVKAREASTPEERRAAIEELQRLLSFLQTIRSMYTNSPNEQPLNE